MATFFCLAVEQSNPTRGWRHRKNSNANDSFTYLFIFATSMFIQVAWIFHLTLGLHFYIFKYLFYLIRYKSLCIWMKMRDMEFLIDIGEDATENREFYLLQVTCLRVYYYTPLSVDLTCCYYKYRYWFLSDYTLTCSGLCRIITNDYPYIESATSVSTFK